MSLQTGVSALAERIAEEFNDIRAGGTDTTVSKTHGLSLGIDTRSNTLEYNGDGTLKKITIKSGATTVSTTTINYSDGRVSSVVQVAGGSTVTTTFNYTDDDLTSTTKLVT